MPTVESNGNNLIGETVAAKADSQNLNLKINSPDSDNAPPNPHNLQLPLTTSTSFTLTRKRRVELSPVDELVEDSGHHLPSRHQSIPEANMDSSETPSPSVESSSTLVILCTLLTFSTLLLTALVLGLVFILWRNRHALTIKHIQRIPNNTSPNNPELSDSSSDFSFELPQGIEEEESRHNILGQSGDHFSRFDEKDHVPRPPPRAKHANNPAAADLQGLPESNVLRKVASLTLEQNTSKLPKSKQQNQPKNNLEKLDLKFVEKFEGQMLLNWFISSLDDSSYQKELIVPQDLKVLATQFSSLLLSADVLRRIETPTEIPNSTPTTPVTPQSQENIFKPDLMYCWNRSELNPLTPSQSTPGKLPPVWPPPPPPVEESEADEKPKNEAKYTEAGDDGSEVRGQVKRIEETNKKGEYQHALKGIKKEHKEVLKEKEAEYEVKVFSMRGESEELLDKYTKRIKELEEEVETLKAQIQAPEDEKEGESETKDVEPVTNCPPIPPPMPPPSMGGDAPTAPPPPPPPPMPGALSESPPCPPPLPGSFTIPNSPGLAGPIPPPMNSPTAGGPCPLPPPPPGAWQIQIAEARKKPITPRVPMKPLYWNRIQIKPPIGSLSTTTSPYPSLVETEPEKSLESIDPKESESIGGESSDGKPDEGPKEKEDQLWEKLEEVPIENLDEFVDLFSRQIVEKKVWKRADESEKVKHRSAKILQSKRSQNVGILMRSLNLNIDIVREAIFKFDLSLVDLETFEKLLEIRAIKEEIQLLEEHVQRNPIDDPHSIPLDKPDRFLYEMNLIPLFVDRINCITFSQFSFFDFSSTIESKLSNLSLVCEQLVFSKELQRVLALILTLGNYMNGGSVQRGQADGFSLEILPKLKDVKSKNNSFTFLHFIVVTYIRRYDEARGTPEAKLPVPEESDIERAASLNFDNVAKELEDLKQKLQECERQSERVIFSNKSEALEEGRSDADHCHFKQIMEGFLEAANTKMKELDDHLFECKQTFLRVVRYFAFVPRKPDVFLPKEFFSAWLLFCHDFKEIWKNEQQRIFKERIREAEAVVNQKRTAFYKNIVVKKARSGGLREKFRRGKEKDKDKNQN